MLFAKVPRRLDVLTEYYSLHDVFVADLAHVVVVSLMASEGAPSSCWYPSGSHASRIGGTGETLFPNMRGTWYGWVEQYSLHDRFAADLAQVVAVPLMASERRQKLCCRLLTRARLATASLEKRFSAAAPASPAIARSARVRARNGHEDGEVTLSVARRAREVRMRYNKCHGVCPCTAYRGGVEASK
jgi:hypothetical protein